MAFQFVLIFYWLALATWFGAVLFLAIASPVILRAVRDARPILPTVLSVNLEGQHGTLLGGNIISAIVTRLSLVELLAAAALIAAQVGLLLLADTSDSHGNLAILRGVAFVGAVAMLVAQRWVIWPRINAARDQYLADADNPEIANPALDRFELHQRRAVWVLQFRIALLLAMITFSGVIIPRGTSYSASPAPTSTR